MHRFPHRPGYPAVVAAFATVLLLAGVLVWFLPALTRKQQPVAGVPTPPALFALGEFGMPPHGQACMSSVTITPEVGLVYFHLRPQRPTPAGGPPVEVILSGAGYRATVHVPGGYPGGSVTLPVTPPRRTLIGSACFLNRGHSTVLLDGTAEARTIARSATVIDGRPVGGDIALTFLSARQSTVLHRLGTIFAHASNLTDGLVPVWLVWAIAILAAAGIPIAAIAAFSLALLADEGRLAPAAERS